MVAPSTWNNSNGNIFPRFRHCEFGGFNDSTSLKLGILQIGLLTPLSFDLDTHKIGQTRAIGSDLGAHGFFCTMIDQWEWCWIYFFISQLAAGWLVSWILPVGMMKVLPAFLLNASYTKVVGILCNPQPHQSKNWITRRKCRNGAYFWGWKIPKLLPWGQSSLVGRQVAPNTYIIRATSWWCSHDTLAFSLWKNRTKQQPWAYLSSYSRPVRPNLTHGLGAFHGVLISLLIGLKYVILDDKKKTYSPPKTKISPEKKSGWKITYNFPLKSPWPLSGDIR